MNPTFLRGFTVLGAVLVLAALNFSILGKERIKRDGELVYLALAPVDPRSLMQGDYMALRFALVQSLEQSVAETLRASASANADVGVAGLREGSTAFASVSIDARHVATLAVAPSTGSLKLRYRIRGGAVWLGTNAFFFQEGSAERFNGARYGEFRVDRQSGEAVLVGLRDEALKAL
ncbi:MAG TPA: GDYXXLXY domain-containing protein [Ideonella sp.]|nr:GDYXXLXY domain-containing protein [Ideonella sp.]